MSSEKTSNNLLMKVVSVSLRKRRDPLATMVANTTYEEWL